MQYNLPGTNKMAIVEAIHWHTKKLLKHPNIEKLVNGKYQNEYKAALLRWKKELNRKALAERNQFLKAKKQPRVTST